MKRDSCEVVMAATKLVITPALAQERSKLQAIIMQQKLANEALGERNKRPEGAILKMFADGLEKAGKTFEEINYLVYGITP
jgi:hypothetical protein